MALQMQTPRASQGISLRPSCCGLCAEALSCPQTTPFAVSPTALALYMAGRLCHLSPVTAECPPQTWGSGWLTVVTVSGHVMAGTPIWHHWGCQGSCSALGAVSVCMTQQAQTTAAVGPHKHADRMLRGYTGPLRPGPGRTAVSCRPGLTAGALLWCLFRFHSSCQGGRGLRKCPGFSWMGMPSSGAEGRRLVLLFSCKVYSIPDP